MSTSLAPTYVPARPSRPEVATRRNWAPAVWAVAIGLCGAFWIGVAGLLLALA